MSKISHSIYQTARLELLRFYVICANLVADKDWSRSQQLLNGIGRVITLYARGAGVNGKHGLVVDGGKPNINAFSYIGVRLYELDSRSRGCRTIHGTEACDFMFGLTFDSRIKCASQIPKRKPRVGEEFEDFEAALKLAAPCSRSGAFSPVTQQTLHLQTSTFAHLPSIQVLAVVRNPRMAQNAAILSDDDFRFFSKLRVTRGNVSTAIKKSKKRKEGDNQGSFTLTRRARIVTEESLYMELLAAEHSGEEPDDGALEGSGDDYDG
ncbi:hypothetical protein GGX14DRAFT_390169 [Mycena pura]|uniref:Uncharacterized protein n=1 Tax=Mycena pura TaxID=153505 RepID=A0AAD6VSJ8_9AGAR|nr:hypothetical protein GGX14DRAFT_390169 [Mycena pura]